MMVIQYTIIDSLSATWNVVDSKFCLMKQSAFKKISTTTCVLVNLIKVASKSHSQCVPATVKIWIEVWICVFDPCKAAA